MRRFFVWMLSIGMLFLGMDAAHGQTYPNKVIRVVTSDAGGGNDFAARLVSPGLAAGLGQPVIVENRGGGGGSIAADTVAKAAPDGYTLLCYASNIWVIPFLRDDCPYDPVKDFIPISLLATSPSVLVIHPSLPVKSVKELIALAKSKPGKLNYATGGTGSTTHIAGELFKAMAGVDIMRVGYKSNGPAVIELMAGQTQLMFATAASVVSQIKSGKLKALAVTSKEPSAMFPGLPPVAADLPGFESISLYGMFAPAKTPAPIIARLNQEILRVLKGQDVKDKFLKTGVEAAGSTPAELAAIMKADMARVGKVIKDAGIREEQ
jgi:tripartite-type tricarboxylate transporter receptor subunit TctC